MRELVAIRPEQKELVSLSHKRPYSELNPDIATARVVNEYYRVPIAINVYQDGMHPIAVIDSEDPRAKPFYDKLILAALEPRRDLYRAVHRAFGGNPDLARKNVAHIEDKWLGELIMEFAKARKEEIRIGILQDYGSFTKELLQEILHREFEDIFGSTPHLRQKVDAFLTRHL